MLNVNFVYSFLASLEDWAGLSSEQNNPIMKASRLPSSSLAEIVCARRDEADWFWAQVELTWSWATESGYEAIRYLWPPCVAGADIIFSSRGFFFYLLLSSIFFFPHLISAVADSIPPHVVWPYSANLGCSSERCCTRLAENTRRKKSPKIRHLGTIAPLSRAIFSQLTHISTILKNC